MYNKGYCVLYLRCFRVSPTALLVAPTPAHCAPHCAVALFSAVLFLFQGSGPLVSLGTSSSFAASANGAPDLQELAGSSTQTRCVEYYYIISRRDIIGEAGATSLKCMVRYARTGPARSTQHGMDIGWSATCDREFTIVVHINIVMSYGSSHMHAMLNTKQT